MDPSSENDGLTWQIPAKYGYGEAVQSAGTVVAPLLAGFSISLTVLVVDRAEAMWSADLALGLLVGAAAVLLGAIQCAYSARQYLVTPDQIEPWWPELGAVVHPKFQLAWDRARADQRAHAALHSRWAGRFRRAYHLGVLLVLLALIAILLPPDGIEPSRWVPIGIALLAVLADAGWVTAVILAGHWDRNAVDPQYRARRKAAHKEQRAEVKSCRSRTEGKVIRRVVRWIVPSYDQREIAGTPYSRPLETDPATQKPGGGSASRQGPLRAQRRAQDS